MVFIRRGLLGKHSRNKLRNCVFANNGLIRGLPEIVFLLREIGTLTRVKPPQAV
jgi:hypothetical protein